jgi:hypothetical protein
MYPPTPTSYRNKIILLTVLVTMVITSVIWIGIGASGYWLIYKEPPSFQIIVESPDIVELGKEFEVKISVENVGEEDIDLANIDLSSDLLDGFELIRITPKPTSIEKIYGYHSYNVLRELGAGKKHELTIILKAKEVGHWAGDIDACNIVQNLVTHYTEIEVVDPEATVSPESEADAPVGNQQDE